MTTAIQVEETDAVQCVLSNLAGPALVEHLRPRILESILEEIVRL